jgi:hypothetical protein
MNLRSRIIEDNMRITLNIEDGLLEKASWVTGIEEKAELIRRGLVTLIARESGKRLAQLGGSEKQLRPMTRRVSP